MEPQKELRWEPDMTVGNLKLDLQHKALIGLINELATEKARNKPDVFAHVLTRLTNLFSEHFTLEEKYMEKHGYPFLEKHKSGHRQFIKQLSIYNIEFNHQVPTRAEEVFRYAASWFIAHDTDVDIKYMEFIESKRRKAESG